MRIVGGEFRGRSLVTPKTDSIRPTTDRTRESLFNILSHGYAEKLNGTRVLDLFSGTGALGIEALSRGGRYCLFVEESAEGRGLLRENVDALALQGRTRIFRRDATDLGPIGPIDPFDLIFADPPYNNQLGERALSAAAEHGWFNPDALIVFEESNLANPIFPPSFELVEKRAFGETIIRILQWSKP